MAWFHVADGNGCLGLTIVDHVLWMEFVVVQWMGHGLVGKGAEAAIGNDLCLLSTNHTHFCLNKKFL